ncbi:MAG: hypothetical protein HYZ83_08735 [Candidatus Omnitrophica bacterium]|nr:hypothetical protein [Candidatus Omnitrophota bacterium]
MAKEGSGSDENCLYFDMNKQERDSAIRYLLGAIINTRTESNFPSNYYTFDEDVNVYLAHLLFAVSLPEYHEMAEPYLSLESSDILKWVRATEDRTIRYFIFKVNADHLLIHSAIFDDLEKKGYHKIFSRSDKHYRDLAKLYYDQAAAYHKRIYRKKTGVGEVLQKISKYFDAYQHLLRNVRRDYFNFLNSFRDQVFQHFMTEVSKYEKNFAKKSKLDHFLELYAQWIAQKNPDLKMQILALARELSQLDPEFKFDPAKDFHEKGGDQDERQCA